MDKPEFLQSSNPQEPTLHQFGASSHDNCEFLAQADQWTPEEKQYFENAFSRNNNPGSQTFIEFFASKFPHKSLEEIKNQYVTLFKEVKMANSTNNNDVVVIAADYHHDDDHQQHHEVTGEDNSSLNGVLPRVENSHSYRRQREIPWTEGEHQLFLMGLNKFGKGDWKSISRYYVISKTPTQVASHAQKYFCRQNSQTPVDRRHPSINDIQTVTFTPKRKTTSPPKINNNILAYNNNCQVGSSSMPFHYPNYYPSGGPTFTKDSNENFERYHRGEASSSNSFVQEISNNKNNNIQRPKSPRPFPSINLSFAGGNNPQV